MATHKDQSTTSKRSVGRPKGGKNTPEQNAALAEGRKKALAVRAERKAKRRAAKEKPRWKQLEDGDITVRDLTWKELTRGEVSNSDGSWEGRRHALPPGIINKMRQEFYRRTTTGLHRLTPTALKHLGDRVRDDDNPAQQMAAIKMVVEYGIGKPVEQVHITAGSEYDRLQTAGFVILRGEENVSVDGDKDIVDAEVVNDEEAVR